MLKNFNKNLLIPVLIMLGVILLVSLSLNTNFASDVTININDKGGIVAQLDNLSVGAGDTIFLNPETYKGDKNTGLRIFKNITIQGKCSPNKVVIDAEGKRQIFDNSGMDELFDGNPSKALKGNVVKEYKMIEWGFNEFLIHYY